MWKDWLSFSKREQKGFIVLSVLLFFMIVFYLLIPVIFPVDMDEQNKTDQRLKEWLDSLVSVNFDQSEVKESRKVDEDSIFFFDPNTVKIKELQKLGIKGDVLINWLKLRESGFVFTHPDDILKIYGINSVTAHTLLPYVRLDRKVRKNKMVHVSSKKSASNGMASDAVKKEKERAKKKEYVADDFVIELNSADTAELALLKGIGPVLSARIVAFRRSLGGYYSAEQLKEVYGMPDSVIENNIKFFIVDTSKIKKININKASLRKMKDHPYIDFYLAKAILEYRKKNGSIKSIDEVLLFKEVKPEVKNKLPEYLTVE